MGTPNPAHCPCCTRLTPAFILLAQMGTWGSKVTRGKGRGGWDTFHGPQPGDRAPFHRARCLYNLRSSLRKRLQSHSTNVLRPLPGPGKVPQQEREAQVRLLPLVALPAGPQEDLRSSAGESGTRQGYRVGWLQTIGPGTAWRSPCCSWSQPRACPGSHPQAQPKSKGSQAFGDCTTAGQGQPVMVELVTQGARPCRLAVAETNSS